MLYTLLSFIILNLIHLLGFFFASLALKVTETNYFLGFNPCLFSFHVRGTKFSIGLYIPIVGLARVYTVVNGEKQRAKYPWEFFNQSLRARFLATMSGPVLLLIFGLLIFIGLNYFVSEPFISKAEVNRHGIYPSNWAKASGFQRGDKIIAVNGKDYEQFSDLINPNVLIPGSHYKVSRNGKESIITIKEADPVSQHKQLFVSLLVPFEVQSVMPGYPADEAGIVAGDRIVKVNGNSIIKFDEMVNEFAADEDGNVSLDIQRKENGSVKTLPINVALNSERKIGIFPKELIDYTTRERTLSEAIPNGVYAAFTSLSTNIRALIRAVSGTLAPTTLGGPIRITSASEIIFWKILGEFAMFYAAWNLFPLPKSAFWEMIALGYTGITKARYSYTTFKRSLNAAWIIAILFILWTFVNDVISLLS
jgi:regulator of sigma E protease